MTIEPKPRRPGRLALLLGALILAGSTALATWWTTTLVGLPDVGDPFDVAAFCRAIPDESNAFVVYRQAVGLLPQGQPNLIGDWKSSSQEERQFLDRSRGALMLWRGGTERPDALHVDPRAVGLEHNLDVAMTLRTFGRLALLEGSRLEEGGDVRGAFEWYRALLRTSRHCGSRGTLNERLVGIAMHRWAVTRLTRWAVDPRVDADLLRRALDAAVEAGAATPPTSDALKASYLSILHSLDDPELMVRTLDNSAIGPGPGGRPGISLANAGLRMSLIRVRRRAIQEPERSRRVIRLCFANWLGRCDLPPARQPPKALSPTSVVKDDPASVFLGGLYAVEGEGTGSGRGLPPEKLARWYASTTDAVMTLPPYNAIEMALARERSAQGTLLMTLANECFQREHGRPPEDLEELVGPYLKALPEGYQALK